MAEGRDRRRTTHDQGGDDVYEDVIKINRFGYVKRAFHGTRPLEFDKQRRTYSRTSVELRDSRWVFLNTFFAISEACMFMQLIDLMDAGKLPEVKTYDTLYKTIRSTLDAAHAEGRLKKEIIADPKRFVDIDPDMPLALLDQKKAGKKILLITNSEWEYAAPMLEYAFDQFLPDKMTWRDLFDFSIVGAGKPSFFSSRTQAFEVVDPSGLLRGHTGLLEDGGIYVGANAALVEKSLQLEGEEILYVGDHLFADVNVTKNILRWRTALVLRELENDMLANDKFAADQIILDEKGTIIELNKWGMKKLAYLIKKESLGYYVYCDYAGTPAAVSEIERKFRIDDTVLKYMTIKTAQTISEDQVQQAIGEVSAREIEAQETEVAEEKDTPEEPTKVTEKKDTSEEPANVTEKSDAVPAVETETK